MNTSILLKVLILGAMDVETDLLIKKIGNPEPVTFGTYQFYEGVSGGKKIIVGRINIGEINAASATTAGILKYNPDLVIIQGTAGGHSPLVHRKDIVIGYRLINAACMLTESKGKNEGIHAENWNLMDWELFDENDGLENEKSIIPAIFADKTLVEKAMKIPYRHGKVFKGTISSSDNWNRELDRINLFVERYDSFCEEMESYAAVQVAKRNKIPVLPVRIISNSEQHNETYERETGCMCQEFVWDFVSSL